jgi:AcrR family transcriptional regulator
VRAVLEATTAELARVGYSGLRMEDVAAKAGVNKTTIYRRWPTKPLLVGAAVRSHKGPVLDPPKRGSLRQDLLDLLSRANKRADTPEGQCVLRMLVQEADHPEVAALTHELRREHRAPWIDVVERAIAAGELPEGTDPEIVVELLVGIVTIRRLLHLHDPVPEGLLASAVELIVTGAQHGGAKRRGAASRRAVRSK